VHINFKQPKYILPLIVLPFLVLFFFIFGGTAKGSGELATTAQDSLLSAGVGEINPNLPGASSQVADGAIKDKFEALQEAYKDRRDFSALSVPGAAPDGGLAGDFSSAYTNEDLQAIMARRQLDSLSRSLDQNKASLDNKMQRMMRGGGSSRSYNSPTAYPDPHGEATAAEVYRRLQQAQANYPGAYDQGESRKPDNRDELSVFREQMRIMDSMQKASTGYGASAAIAPHSPSTRKNSIDPAADSSFQPLPVVPVGRNSQGFNTVKRFAADEGIRAVIDQKEKVGAGSRVRIKLLQDILVGEELIGKGSLIYGMVTGFQVQRVNISITQIMQGGVPLPVKLDVFDSDGYLGLYVPGSNFREFSKEIGTQGTNGLSSVNMAGDGSTSLLSRVFTTTSSTINRMIRTEKATLKTNYIIYLKEKN